MNTIFTFLFVVTWISVNKAHVCVPWASIDVYEWASVSVHVLRAYKPMLFKSACMYVFIYVCISELAWRICKYLINLTNSKWYKSRWSNNFSILIKETVRFESFRSFPVFSRGVHSPSVYKHPCTFWYELTTGDRVFCSTARYTKQSDVT